MSSSKHFLAGLCASFRIVLVSLFFDFGLSLSPIYPAPFAQAGELPPALPVPLTTMLESLPGKRLSVEVVVQRAKGSTDSSQAIEAQKLAWGAPKLLASSRLQPELHANIGWQDNRNQPANPFSTSRTLGWQGAIGVSTQLQSGTSLRADLLQQYVELSFPNPAFSVAPYYETQLRLGVTQSLIADFFGRSTRLALEEGEALTELQPYAFQEALQGWTLELVQLYYQAWMAQHQARASSEAIQRAQRLYRVMQTKLQRGTAERPDLLQAQSATLQANSQALQAKLALDAVWRSLVLNLKFDPTWIGVDATLIPLSLEDPAFRKAPKLCGDQPEASLPKETASTARSRLQLEAAQKKVRRLSANNGTDLLFEGGLATNAVDSSITPPWGNALSIQFPHWQLGLQFRMPLGNGAIEAESRQARAEAVRSEAENSLALTRLRDQWLQACHGLESLSARHAQLTEVHALKSQRARLEETRFELGRVTIQQVLQAQEEAAAADTQLASVEVDLRQTAWQILHLSAPSSETPKE